jgi:hypothetical protein
MKTGVSPKVAKYKEGKIICLEFRKGKSICCTSKKRPFVVPPVRLEGERVLLERMKAP